MRAPRVLRPATGLKRALSAAAVLAALALGSLRTGPAAADPPAPPASPRFERLVARARRRVAAVTPEELRRRLEAPGGAPVLVDVREDSEWAQGRIPGAAHLSRGVLERRIEALVPDAGAPIVLYCASGARSVLAAESLGRMGYTRVSSLEGGYGAWTRAGLPTAGPPPRR